MSEQEANTPPSDNLTVASTTTTTARSWAELIETLQGGLAIIDDEWRFAFVSERFLPFLGPAAILVGQDVGPILHALGVDDPRSLRGQIEEGIAVEFEQQVLTPGDDRRWAHVKVVPSANLGTGMKAVVFTKDTTAVNRALSDLRAVTLSLTEIEDALHRRVGRELHDGPIQLLAALILRLDVLADTNSTFEIREAATAVSTHLRHAIADLSDENPLTSAGSQLERWIAPFLIGGPIDFDLDDQLASQPSETAIQSAFVFIYEMVRAARYIDRPRLVRLSLSDERDGYRLILTATKADGLDIRVGRAAAQYRGVVAYTQSVGGTVSTKLDDGGVRTVNAWIPRVSEPEPVGRIGAPDSNDEPDLERQSNEISSLPELTAEAWKEIATEAPERLNELDDQTRFTFLNRRRQDLYGYDEQKLIGRRMETVIDPASLGDLVPQLKTLRSGGIVDFEWSRPNAYGDLRRVRLRASPRLSENGDFEGFLVSEHDLSEVMLLESLAESALADFTKARRFVATESLLRLEAPVAACEELIEKLREFEESTSDAEPFRAIRTELEDAVPRVRLALTALATPDLSTGDLGSAVRTSVVFALTDAELAFVDDTRATPPVEAAEVLFRIAREAVINAVVHGKADLITMTLSNERDGIRLLIHDDGIGIADGDLDRKPGHLGTRSMMERARERGGNCRIEPAAQGGTLVSVWLPLITHRVSLLDGVASPDL